MINATQIQKLLNAGLIVIDGKDHPSTGLSIWTKTKDKREWHLFEKGFATRAALKRRMVELCKSAWIVDIYDGINRI